MEKSKLRIPYVNLKLQHEPLKQEILNAISGVIDSGDFILGQEVKNFEEAFARYCGTRFALGVNSGTDALFLCLKAYGIGIGDEVITAPNSFLASATVIAAVGATPVFVDVRSDMNIDPTLIEAKITKNTKAIIPVHLAGKPADMNAIMKIALKYNLKVIEDAAQAVGAELDGKKVGNLSHAGCMSMHPLKILNACGDGGCVVTNDPELYDHIIQLRNIGQKQRGIAYVCGFNSRLDSMQAAVLNVKMKYLDQWIAQQRENAQLYVQHLGDQVIVPIENKNEKSVYARFVIQTPRREELKKYLQDHGIGCEVHYPLLLHLQPCFTYLGYKVGDFPESEKQAGTILSLPVYHGLLKEEIEEICRLIKEFL